jgi:hypothetical protein
MDRISRMLQNQQGGQGGANMAGPPTDSPQVDTAEQIYISSLALLKMLKHGKPFVKSWTQSWRSQVETRSAGSRSFQAGQLAQAGCTAPGNDSSVANPQAVLACPWRSWASCWASSWTTTP